MAAVISTWRRKWHRLARLSWDELHTRVGQEFNKRIDLALYRANLQPHRNGNYPLLPSMGSFFFRADDVPGRAQLLKQHLPSVVQETLREADAICRHQFSLLGYADLNYGAEIDWHLDVVHGKRAPLKPWYKIHFLDFDEVGDHKITWELNRHQHLVTLAKAWCLTGEDRYVTELMAQWYAWQKANPYPLGINWGSSLEVAFRSLSWLWVRQLLAGCPAVPEAFWADMLQGLAINGWYIARYLSTYFSPNTHLLGEAVGLLFIGTLCPQLPAAQDWRRDGWQILLREAERQVRPDGIYFEQALYYHVYALDLFQHARLLAVHNQIEIPASFDRILERMLDFLQAVSQVEPPDSFGDDDGGRLFNPRRNRAEHLTDPLAIGAVAFRRDDLKDSATPTEEALWLFGDEAVACLGTRPATRPSLQSKSFADGGVYVMANGDGFAQQMVIDAGPQGTGRCGHGHADALSLRVSIGDRRWLEDRGTFCYISNDHERDRFRGTRAHNTLCVDGLDQAVPDGPFGWSSIPDVSTETWMAGETFSLFAGSHTGYRRLPDPVTHQRFVFHLHGGFWLVRDVAEGTGTHDLEIAWHFAPGLTAVEAGSGAVATASQASQQGCLGLIAAHDSGWKCEIGTQDTSPAYGQKEPAPVVRFKARTPLPAACATLILPMGTASDIPGTLTEVRMDPGSIDKSPSAYRYTSSGGTHYLVFADAAKKPWKMGPWESDARFLYCRVQDGRLAHLIFCGGSFATVQGKTLLPPQRTVERLEWIWGADGRRVVSSDETTVHSLSEEALESDDFVF
jgi:hypothetical protein